MRPAYDPTAAWVPDEEVMIDDHQVYWRGDERLNGVVGEQRASGVFEFLSFANGYREGPTGELTPDGDLIYEEWYRENFLYGISRWFRADGTLQTAVGYEYGVEVWRVEFASDGEAVRSTAVHRLGENDRWTIDHLRSQYPLPPVRGPEDAADITKH